MKDHLEIFFENPWSYIFGFILFGLFYYFKKKLENLADKSDVAEITREVESVKSEFNTDLEKLKSNLDVLKSNKISLINEKKNSIYGLWTIICKYNSKVDSFLGFDIKGFEDSKKCCQEIDLLYFEFYEKLSVFELILNDKIEEGFEKDINEFMVTLIDREKSVKIALVELGRYLEIDKSYSIQKYSKKIEEIKSKVDIKNDLYYKNYKKIKFRLIEILKKIHE